MKKRFSPLLLVVVLALVVVGFSSCSVLGSASDSDSAIQKQLSETASQLTASCPVAVDDETQLDSVVALPGKTLEYNYTLVNYAQSDLTSDEVSQLQDSMQSQILNSIETSDAMATLRKDQVTFEYTYKTNDGAELFSLTFAPSDYSVSDSNS